MGRNPCCSGEDLNRGAWTSEEDRILRAYIKANGEGRWRSLPKKSGLKRCGKSCRLRWLNYLRPDIKRGNITHEEEDLIIRLHKLLGNRWSLIAGRLPGRTDNEIKNYWNTQLRKKAKDQQRVAVEAATPSNGDKTCFDVPQEKIVKNEEQNAIVKPVVTGNLATEKAAESKSESSSCFEPQEDNWWDFLMELDASNTYPSRAPGFDLIHDTREDWMQSDIDLDLKALATLLNCEEEWLGFLG